MPFPPLPGRTLKSLREFEEALGDLAPDGRWIFRGVLENWKALTSLDRVALAWDIPPDHRQKLEFRLTRDFGRHPEGAEALGALRDDTLYVWSLMQHHGAPTRLMDWTYSPYVAAFFAFDELI